LRIEEEEKEGEGGIVEFLCFIATGQNI